jgi:hypothetical protein
MTRAFKAAAVVQDWPNPAFLPWLVLSRASGRPDLLAQAAGAATFRWRRDATQPFRTHAWQLDRGVPDLKQRGVFPI